MLCRYGSSLSLGLAVTLGLLLLMQSFVAIERGRVSTERPPALVEFVRVARPPPERPPVEPPARPTVEPPPPAPTLDGDTGGIVVEIGVRPQPPAVPAGFSLGQLGVADAELLAIVTVAPSFPPAAAERGLEGYVVVEYTVNRDGSVRDVIVVESSSRVFEKAAVEAAYKFRYRPRIVGGTPVAVAGIRQRMRFILDEDH